MKACSGAIELSMKSIFLVFVILCAAFSAESQTEPKTGGTAPSLAAASSQSPPGGQGASLADTVINAAQYPSIQAAIEAVPTRGGEVWIPCGTYVGNITITRSNLWLHGAGWQCVNLEPGADGDMVVLDASQAGANGINFDRIDGLMLANHKGWNGSGLVLKGGANQPNDWHTFDSMVITGFYNGIDIRDRDIWSTYNQVFVANSTNNGLNVDNTAASVDHDAWRDGRIFNSRNYGVYWKANQSFSILFDHENIEYNGTSGTLKDCAGLYMTLVGTAGIENSYFEGNCMKSPDGMGADIRLSGTYTQAVDITGSLIWSQTDYGILNDSVLSTGSYFGNYVANKRAYPILISTRHALSMIDVGCNFENGGTNKYVVNTDGNDHVIDTCAGKRNLATISPDERNTISVANTSYAEVGSGENTVDSMTGGYTGQMVTLEAKSSGLTIGSNARSGRANTFTLPGDASLGIPAGGAASFVLAADQTWHLLAGTYVTASSTQKAGQLACIKSAGPPAVLGTCTAVNGAVCTKCE